jgi:hypothetical protein
MADIAFSPIDTSSFMPRSEAEATIANLTKQINDTGFFILGTVTLAESATVAISAGTRRLTITTPTAWNVVAGQNLLLFPVSVPSGGYATHDVIATAANIISVGLTAPLLAIGASYSIPARLARFGVAA